MNWVRALRTHAIAYVKTLLHDYKSSLKDTFEHSRQHPLQAALWTGTISGLVALNWSNPNYPSYIQRVVASNDELSLISEAIRSERADHYVQGVFKLHSQGRLRRQNFLLFSVIVAQKHADATCVYEARCAPLNRFEFSDYFSRILDFGIAGQWLVLQSMLKDCDVNEKEFTDDNTSQKQFQFAETIQQRFAQNVATSTS